MTAGNLKFCARARDSLHELNCFLEGSVRLCGTPYSLWQNLGQQLPSRIFGRIRRTWYGAGVEIMGSLTYDFLTESFLFSDDLITEQFKTVSDSELEKELRRYREFCLSRETELFSEIRSHL